MPPQGVDHPYTRRRQPALAPRERRRPPRLATERDRRHGDRNRKPGRLKMVKLHLPRKNEIAHRQAIAYIRIEIQVPVYVSEFEVTLELLLQAAVDVNLYFHHVQRGMHTQRIRKAKALSKVLEPPK